MLQPVSLDEIMSHRAGSVRQTKRGEGLLKVAKAPASWNEEQRSARFVMTAEVVDRYGDIVVTKGGDLTEFEKNPVALWAHNSRAFPIGMWSDIKKISGTPRRMEGTANFSPDDIDEDTDTAVKLVAAGMLRACSIGFLPKAWESIKDEEDRFTGYRFLEWELLECSVCSIPANPAAIIKSADGDRSLALQAISLVLDEYAMTPDGLIVPRKDYELAYQFVKNKDVTIHEVRAIEEPAAAPSVELNPLDISAAVSEGIVKALSGEGVIAKIKLLLGIETKTVETPPAAEVVTPPVVELNVTVDDDGETEEQFQARLAASKAAEDLLADEEEELRMRARASELA